jgi:hypothetical protein
MVDLPNLEHGDLFCSKCHDPVELIPIEGAKVIGSVTADTERYKHRKGYGKYCNRANMGRKDTTPIDWNA